VKQDIAIPARTLRVLVVDDEPDVLDLLHVALTSLRHWDVARAASAGEALALLQGAAAFDLLLLDIQMPGMSGVELLAALRQLPGHADTPVLMLTAMSDRDYLDAAFREGAHDYVTKPFDYDDLLVRLDAVMAPRRLEDLRDADRPPRLIGRFAFGNYIAQLSANRLVGSKLVAVRMLGGQGAADHARLVEAVAEATAPEACLFCSYGADSVVVLTHADWILTDALGAAALTRRLQMRGGPARRIVVGAPVSLREVDRDGVLAAMQAAVGAAAQSARADVPVAAPAPVPAPAPAPAAPRGENLFETVLREMHGEASYLGARSHR
jgi:CheY-like chemotaxis protein